MKEEKHWTPVQQLCHKPHFHEPNNMIRKATKATELPYKKEKLGKI